MTEPVRVIGSTPNDVTDIRIPVCSIMGCEEVLYTIYQGYALCEPCLIDMRALPVGFDLWYRKLSQAKMLAAGVKSPYDLDLYRQMQAAKSPQELDLYGNPVNGNGD